jgi:hypothetical protein
MNHHPEDTSYGSQPLCHSMRAKAVAESYLDMPDLSACPTMRRKYTSCSRALCLAQVVVKLQREMHYRVPYPGTSDGQMSASPSNA